MKKKRKISKVAKLSGESLDIKAGQIEKLKSLFPQTVKDGEIDFDALKLTLGGETDDTGSRLSYGLSWAGKADCFRHIQEATTATLKPDKKESVNFDNTENIFIEGDNLEVLKVLQKNYHGKIKMIYIDPPYNTGNDSFIYPDRFKEEKADYEERAGIKDAEGLLTKDGFFRKNSKDTGHFHSNWLCMMYPRLFLAKNLLRQDGVIFVSIDDNEVHNLRMVMNEIFGEENFAAELIWKSRQNKDNRNLTGVSIDHEYILVYTRNFGNRIKGSERNKEQYKNPDNDPRGDWVSGNMVGLLPEDQRPNCHYDLLNPHTGINYGKPKMGWRYDKNTMKQLIDEDRIIWPKNVEGRPRRKVFLSELNDEFTGYSSIVGVDIYTRNGTVDFEELFESRYMEFPKPKDFIKDLLNQGLDGNDTVLDFFAGSCTTAHAIMALNAEDGGNRKYICVQLAEPCDEKSEAFKAGYKTIADIGKERIRRAGKKIKKETQGKLNFDGGKLDLGFKVFKLDESNFKQWQENIKTGEELKEQLKMFVDNKKKGSAPEDMLYEIILKNSRFDLNVPIEKKTFDGIEYYRLATEDTHSTSSGQAESTEKIKADSGNKKIHHEEKEEHEEKTGTNAFEIVCLADKITKKLAEKILKEKPQKFTCLDTAFKNNDQLKTNTALQAEATKIEFKVI